MGDTPTFHRFLHRVAHHADRFFMLSLFVSVACYWGLHFDWPGVRLLLAVNVGLMVFTQGVDICLHRGRLCEACMARMPLNGSELAERWQRQLALRHWLGSTRWRGPVVMLGVMLGGVAVNQLYTPLGTSLAMLFLAAMFLATMRHQKVTPWCPYCRHGGGGDEEEAPVAPPAPAMGV